MSRVHGHAQASLRRIATLDHWRPEQARRPPRGARRQDPRRRRGALLLLLWLGLLRLVARASRRLRHQASHDDLTDLPNRTALHQQAEIALAGARRARTLGALMPIDLDRLSRPLPADQFDGWLATRA